MLSPSQLSTHMPHSHILICAHAHAHVHDNTYAIAGMLLKAKGQILQIGATLHVLFHWETPHSIPNNISADALKAAINFVDLSIRHPAHLADRGDVEKAIQSTHESLTLGKHFKLITHMFFTELM